MEQVPLTSLLIERIERSGPVSFAEFMRAALYEPGYGYYMRGEPRIGWEGRDYFTSSDVSALFAHCVGRQLFAMWEQLKRPSPFIVIEQGAGLGDLAAGVRAWAGQDAPDLFAALDYRTEDIGMGQDALQNFDAPAPSVILSNELVDAFPVHVVELRAGRLYEVYVDARDGRLLEVLDEPGSPEVAGYLDRFKVPWQEFEDGWRAEINLDALRWMESVARRLRCGFLFAIDYGEKARALYTRSRRSGTLLSYYRHQMSERPLARPGEQDITAHVNFSALIEAGRRHGLRLNSYTTQRAWLERMGIFEELEGKRAHEYAASLTQRASDQGQVALLQWYALRQGVSILTDPRGMGNFKVLIMRRPRQSL